MQLLGETNSCESMENIPSLLSVQNLRILFAGPKGFVSAVDNISFDLVKGENLAIVGESGCGKTVTSLSIVRLLACPPAKVDGKIFYKNENLLKKTEAEMRKIRGKGIAMIFQEPMTSLNPVLTVGRQIMEGIRAHQRIGKKEGRELTVEMLRKVDIPSPERRINEYPHQLSGGMQQRVMIAIALSCNPEILIADEPTTALDVTIQAQILDLVRQLQDELGTTMILITHNLGVVAELCKKVIVMYAGQIVEKAFYHSLYSNPAHPYSIRLLDSIPKLDTDQDELETIEGIVPSLLSMPSGCRFHPRCLFRKDICTQMLPELIPLNDNHWVSCWKHCEYKPLRCGM